MVEWSPLLKNILPKPPIVSFRRPRNIKGFLVRAKLESEIQSDKGMFGCGTVRCKISKFVKTGSIFESAVEKKSFYINHSIHCDPSGVIYLTTCKRCAKQYVASSITEFGRDLITIRARLIDMVRNRGVFVKTIYMHIFLKKAIWG